MKMKNKNRMIFIIFLLINFNAAVIAQSDYELVQSFKEKYQQLEKEIKGASSLQEIESISPQIEKFRKDYLKYQKLLDKSLYPEDFNGSIENLRKALLLRKDDFTQIDVLQTEVVVLKNQLDELNKKNTELINQVQLLEAQTKTDTRKIAELERRVAELRVSLRQRDELVFSMLDSIIPVNYRQSDLSSAEKQKIFSETKEKNIVENIKKSIHDNIRFLIITDLNPEDINEIKQQQEEFSGIWKNAGPKIVEIYQEKGEKVNNLKEIDSLFTIWRNTLKREIWGSIRDEFMTHGITFNKFSNGDEFTSNVTSYIEDEIKNADVKGDSEVESIYKTFVDTVWYGKIKPDWIPYLIDNSMLNENQKDSIENKISTWKAEVNPEAFNWLYVIIAVLLIFILILLFAKRKPKEEAAAEKKEE